MTTPKETLERELRQFLDDADGGDVLIYYSGHGFTKLDTTSQKPVGGYLAPSDCRVKLDAAGQVIAEENGISLSHGLNKLIQQHHFSSLVVILDCCNAGAFLESAMVRQEVTQFGFQRDYYLITACRSSSKAYEGEEHSLLTHAVLKGLAPENASPSSGRISGDRLFDVIGNELRNSRQEPIHMGWGRLITLVKYAQIPEPSNISTTFNPANPYMGLKPFEREQADYFFGREQAVRALLDRLDQNRFLAVIGPSGCGKSSLVRAGLLSELEEDRIPGSRDWQVKIITPGQYPLQVLGNTLDQVSATDKPILLFVDQFEELFTLCSDEEEQRRFIKRLDQETNDPDKQTRIIVAMRGDFLDRCAKFQESADLINSAAPTTYMVIPLTEAKLVAELEEAITGPAALHGVSFEQGLVARIVDDVINQPGAMPLLQYALTQLWENCISPSGLSRSLTMQSYIEIDGVKGALQGWATQFYTNLSCEDQTFVREMFGELVQIGDGGEATRRRAHRERLRAIAASQEQLDRIIGRLVYQRLLVTDDKTVEVAHEALLSESKLIQRWIEENRDSIRLRQRLEVYRCEWEERDRSENYLLGVGRLAAIDEWIANKHPRLMSVDQEFIEKSRGKRDRDQQEKQRKERQRWMLAAGLLATIAFASVGFAHLQRKNAIASREGEVKILVRLAKNQSENHQQLESLVTSIQALEFLRHLPIHTDKKQEYTDKVKMIIAKVRERNRFEKQESRLYGLSIHPSFGKIKDNMLSDSVAIVSGDSKGEIKFWNIYGKIIEELSQPKAVWNVRFSHDGTLIAFSGFDGVIRLWDVHLKTFQDDLDGHQGGLTDRKSSYSLSFNHKDNLLASSGFDGTVKLWELSNRTKASDSLEASSYLDPQYQNEIFAIYGVDIHPQDDHIIAYGGGGDNQVRIWNRKLISPPFILPRSEAKDFISYVRFSTDGSILAACSNDGMIRLWDSRNNFNLLAEIDVSRHQSVLHCAFDREDKSFYLASANRDGTITIWNLNNVLQAYKRNLQPINEAEIVMEGHDAAVTRLEFSPDNKFIVSASDDGTIRVWDWKYQEFLSKNEMEIEQLISICCQISQFYRKNPKSIPEAKTICQSS